MGLKTRIKGRPWSEEEKEFIKLNYKKIPTREIAAKLNRSIDAIINSAKPLGISAGMSRPWSDEEKDFVKNNYGKIAIEELSQKLKRSPLAISAAASKLNLTKKRKSRIKKSDS